VFDKANMAGDRLSRTLSAVPYDPQVLTDNGIQFADPKNRNGQPPCCGAIHSTHLSATRHEHRLTKIKHPGRMARWNA
jgi:hypothetical protein